MAHRHLVGLGLLAVAAAILAGGAPSRAGDWARTMPLPPPQEADAPAQTAEPNIAYLCERAQGCNFRHFMANAKVCALVVMRDGRIVVYRTAEGTAHAGRCAKKIRKRRYGLASITKSVTSLLLGRLAVAQGRELSQPVAEALAPLGIDYERKTTSLRDLLQMRSGMAWQDKKEVIRVEADENGDPVGPHRTLRQAIDARLRKADFVPDGEAARFNYSGFDTQVLALVATGWLGGGRSLADYFRETIWPAVAPGHRAQWKGDFEMHPAGYCCLYMDAADLARLGAWVLAQYLDANAPQHDWVRTSVQDVRPSNRRCRHRAGNLSFDYGYQWWVPSGSGNGFIGIGTGGQFLHIFPDQRVVIAQLGALADAEDTWERRCESFAVHRLLAK